MTLEEFRATGRDCEDLALLVEGAADWGCAGRPGRVYEGGYWIEKVSDHWPEQTREAALAEGGWYLMLGNQEMIGSLEKLEVELHRFAVDC